MRLVDGCARNEKLLWSDFLNLKIAGNKQKIDRSFSKFFFWYSLFYLSNQSDLTWPNPQKYLHFLLELMFYFFYWLGFEPKTLVSHKTFEKGHRLSHCLGFNLGSLACGESILRLSYRGLLPYWCWRKSLTKAVLTHHKQGMFFLTKKKYFWNGRFSLKEKRPYFLIKYIWKVIEKALNCKWPW